MPYILIFKKKKLRINKILDYIGEMEVEVIDCRTKAGKDRCNELFPHILPQSKRKSHINKINPKVIPLKHFIEPETFPVVKRRKRRAYKRNYNPANPDLVEQFTLPKVDKKAFESKSGYYGSLYQLFLGAELEFFTKLQEEKNFVPLPGYCNFADIARLEFTRIKLDMSDITKFLMKAENWTELLVECGIEQKYFPSYSYYMKILGMITYDDVFKYFLLLQAKCKSWNLYDEEIDVWDGRFLEGYESSSKFKKRAEKRMDEPGVYVHDKKYFGIGYLESRIINYRFCLPKFYFLINPQYNDNQTCLETIYRMIEHEIPLSKIFLADGGPKSKKIKEEVTFFHSIPVIAGQKNASGNILVTEKNRKFYADYIPEELWSITDRIYDARTNIEQSFAYDFKVYDVNILERMGYENAFQYIGLVNCLALLNAIAAVVTDQVHLISKAKAFRFLSLAKQEQTLEEVMLTKIPPKSQKELILSIPS